MKTWIALSLVALAGCHSAPKPRLSAVPDVPYEQRHIIAVLDFENRTGDPENDGVAGAASGLVIDELLQANRFRIVERDRIEQVLAELKLEMTGLVRPGDVKALGRHLGADALLVGDVASISHTQKKNHGGLAYTKSRRTEILVNARLVDLETSEILASSKAPAAVTETEAVALGFARSGGLSAEDTAVRAALVKAVRQLANDIAARAPLKK